GGRVGGGGVDAGQRQGRDAGVPRDPRRGRSLDQAGEPRRRVLAAGGVRARRGARVRAQGRSLRDLVSGPGGGQRGVRGAAPGRRADGSGGGGGRPRLRLSSPGAGGLFPRLAVGPEGGALVVWNERVGKGPMRVAARRTGRAGESWGAIEGLSADTGEDAV